MKKEYLTGGHGAEEALKNGRGMTLYVSRNGGRAGALSDLARKNGISVRRVDERELRRLCPDGDLRGFVLEVRSLESRKQGKVSSLENLIPTLGNQALVVLLDGITDPQNLGTVLRSADQFGADAVIIPKRRSAGSGDAVSRASSGAVEWVSLIEVSNLNRALEILRDAGFWSYGADMSGTPAYETSLSGRTALVMGREGEGLHRLVKESCDGLIRIPTGGRIDSLNVATAAGVLMYEIRRQQNFPYTS